jgi:hypothetical protein
MSRRKGADPHSHGSESHSRPRKQPVSKSRDREVITELDVERRRLLRVLEPVLATSCDEARVRRCLCRPFARDSHQPRDGLRSDPISRQNLARLKVSPRPGYRGIAISLSVATLSQLAPMRPVFRDRHSTPRSASCHLSNQLLRRLKVGTLIARWQNEGQRWCRFWSAATGVGNRRFSKPCHL